MQSIGNFLNLLTNVKANGRDHWQANCPCKSHKTPAKHLSIGLKENKILLTCFGSDTAEDICQALNLTLADLFIEPLKTPTSKSRNIAPQNKIVATYDYQDENGDLLFQVVRYEPKSFAQKHRNSTGEWIWNLEGVRRVLYHLPELIITGPSETIYFVEGEKDADNLWQWGQIATTSPGGANGWQDEYARYLTGKRICIIPDRDGPGMSYARQVANSLIGKAELKTILLPEGTKDISDWLDTGGDIEKLPSLQQDIETLFASGKPQYQHDGDSIIWQKTICGHNIIFQAAKLSEQRTGVHARISLSYDYIDLGWSYFNIERNEDRTRLAFAAHKLLSEDISKSYSKDDLRHDLDGFCLGLWSFHLSSWTSELMVGDIEPQPLKFILKPYILEGGGTILFAAPGRGKSWTGLIWAVAVDAGISTFWTTEQTETLFINLERSRQSVRRRLSRVNLALGLPANRPLRILNARGKSLSNIIASVRSDVQQYDIGLIVLDSISRVGLGDLNENQPVNSIIDALNNTCPTWLALGHTPRKDETHIFGGIHFEAGADIVVQLSSQIAADSTLGIGYEITKQNDLPQFPQAIFALEFNDTGLAKIRKANVAEFPDITSKTKQTMREAISDYILNQDSADATATELGNELGFNRVNISAFLSKSGFFVKTRKVKQNQYYGIKEHL